MKTAGIIGLGIIGNAWAQRYAAAGVLAGTWNRTPAPTAPAWKASAAEVASAADLVQIVVADPPAVESVIQSILPVLGPGKCVVQSSTIDPESSARFEKLVRATGAAYVEAPFTGSKPAAVEGKTVFFLGGREAEMDLIEPVLKHISETRFRIGTGEQAATIKLAMNLNLAIQMEGFAESLTFVRKAGLSDDTYFKVLEKNVGYSGLTKLKEQKLRNHDYAPQFSVKHLHKDLRLASASSGCVEYPLLEAVRERLKTAQARGLGDQDFSIIIQLLGE